MFKVGQKVWCPIFGAGVVEKIRQESGVRYPVLVKFSDELYDSYTSDGKYYAEGNITLFPYPVEIVKAITKPSIDWSQVKDEYKWLSIGADGSAYVSGYKPSHIDGNYQQTQEGSYFTVNGLVSYSRGTCDWKDSLVKRPE